MPTKMSFQVRGLSIELPAAFDVADVLLAVLAIAAVVGAGGAIGALATLLPLGFFRPCCVSGRAFGSLFEMRQSHRRFRKQRQQLVLLLQHRRVETGCCRQIRWR